MIYESSHLNKKEPNIDLSNFKNLMVLSIATSIDAFKYRHKSLFFKNFNL